MQEENKSTPKLEAAKVLEEATEKKQKEIDKKRIQEKKRELQKETNEKKRDIAKEHTLEVQNIEREDRIRDSILDSYSTKQNKEIEESKNKTKASSRELEKTIDANKDNLRDLSSDLRSVSRELSKELKSITDSYNKITMSREDIDSKNYKGSKEAFETLNNAFAKFSEILGYQIDGSIKTVEALQKKIDQDNTDFLGLIQNSQKSQEEKERELGDELSKFKNILASAKKLRQEKATDAERVKEEKAIEKQKKALRKDLLLKQKTATELQKELLDQEREEKEDTRTTEKSKEWSSFDVNDEELVKELARLHKKSEKDIKEEINFWKDHEAAKKRFEEGSYSSKTDIKEDLKTLEKGIKKSNLKLVTKNNKIKELYDKGNEYLSGLRIRNTESLLFGDKAYKRVEDYKAGKRFALDDKDESKIQEVFREVLEICRDKSFYEKFKGVKSAQDKIEDYIIKKILTPRFSTLEMTEDQKDRFTEKLFKTLNLDEVAESLEDYDEEDSKTQDDINNAFERQDSYYSRFTEEVNERIEQEKSLSTKLSDRLKKLVKNVLTKDKEVVNEVAEGVKELSNTEVGQEKLGIEVLEKISNETLEVPENQIDSNTQNISNNYTNISADISDSTDEIAKSLKSQQDAIESKLNELKLDQDTSNRDILAEVKVSTTSLQDMENDLFHSQDREGLTAYLSGNITEPTKKIEDKKDSFASIKSYFSDTLKKFKKTEQTAMPSSPEASTNDAGGGGFSLGKVGKILAGTVAAGAIGGGAYYLYNKFSNKDANKDIDTISKEVSEQTAMPSSSEGNYEDYSVKGQPTFPVTEKIDPEIDSLHSETKQDIANTKVLEEDKGLVRKALVDKMDEKGWTEGNFLTGLNFSKEGEKALMYMPLDFVKILYEENDGRSLKDSAALTLQDVIEIRTGQRPESKEKNIFQKVNSVSPLGLMFKAKDKFDSRNRGEGIREALAEMKSAGTLNNYTNTAETPIQPIEQTASVGEPEMKKIDTDTIERGSSNISLNQDSKRLTESSVKSDIEENEIQVNSANAVNVVKKPETKPSFKDQVDLFSSSPRADLTKVRAF